MLEPETVFSELKGKKKKGPKKPQKMRREWLEVMGSGWRGRQRSDHAGNYRIKYKPSNTVYMP